MGIWTALWTPTDETGALLKEPLKRHLDFLLNNGVTGIAVAGSTGQFTYLDVATRKELLHLVCQHVGPERVFVNISDIRPQNVAELALHAKEEKVRAIMLLPPMYYAFFQADIASYFIHMAKIAARPLVLYNYPECVRNRIELETLEVVAKEVPLVGIKQSGLDFAYHTPLINLGKKIGFQVFTGAENKLQEALNLGVSGNIGGLSNAIPELVVGVFSGFKAQDMALAEAKMRKIREIDSLLKPVCFPLTVAALMEAKGLTPGSHKEILSGSTKMAYKQLVNTLRECINKQDSE